MPYTLGTKTSALVETRTTENIPMVLSSHSGVTAKDWLDFGGLGSAARRQKLDIENFFEMLLNFSSVSKSSRKSQQSVFRQ